MRSLFLLTAVAGCAGTDATDDAVESVCGEPGEEFTAGMEHAGDEGLFTFVLEAADPAPPDEGDNVWTVRVLSGGAEAELASVVIEPFMPEHGHGTVPKTFEAAADGAGGYESAPFDLFMGGLWEITVTAEGTDAAQDSTVFAFCIEA